jgi:hypothetical protein
MCAAFWIVLVNNGDVSRSLFASYDSYGVPAMIALGGIRRGTLRANSKIVFLV